MKRVTQTNLNRRELLGLLAGGTAAATLGGALGCSSSASSKKVVVLGLDGLDPNIVRALMDTGRAPNFKQLAEMGAFHNLGTTMPALSPVAWSSFITGLSPGGHGIADFIMRDPDTYLPVFSIYKTLEAGRSLSLGDYELPLSGGGVENLRRGKPFWAYLTERGIPASVFKIPTNFPIDETATRSVSGMGTPDLADAYGMFNYFTSDEWEDHPNISGGIVSYVDVRDNHVRSELWGPQNTFLTSSYDARRDPHGHVAKVPFDVYIDADADLALIEIQGHKVVLQQGEFSNWVPIEFELLPIVGKVRGICRFLLQDVRPHFRLYVSPINIDPAAQAMPVTYPEELGGELARSIGPFWTKGLPADTKALDYGVFSDENYVKQAELILAERMALFEHEWSRFREGLLYFYVSSTDQDAHMLWRNMDKSHPLHGASDVRFSGYLHHLYEQMDQLVGRVLPAVDNDTLLLVCSDHGFAPFARQFHLNSWLRQKGYLAVKDSASKKELTNVLDIDWSKTVAYGIGFNGLFLNLKGRERDGFVEPDKAGPLLAKLKRELEAIRDGDTGQSPIANVYSRGELYTGEQTPQMAELFVGYTPGFRSSASSVQGETSAAILELNPWAWSGDHSMAHDLVPGTLFSSVPIDKPDPNIVDLPVTILDFFGIEKPPDMVGRSIFHAGRIQNRT